MWDPISLQCVLSLSRPSTKKKGPDIPLPPLSTFPPPYLRGLFHFILKGMVNIRVSSVVFDDEGDWLYAAGGGDQSSRG